jgi:phosphatidylserine/phosphatidylglycerophosphate/cardiolipin synthase-like enzyme
MNKTCGICGVSISDKVADYSCENYKMWMCMDCQKKYGMKYYEFDGCCVYIGTNAGKELLGAIKNARECIDIVSPYISNNFIAELITLAQRGVTIRLFTSKDIGYRGDFEQGKQYCENLKQIISQTRDVDTAAQERRKTLKRRMSLLNIINIFLLFSVPYMWFLLHSYWLLSLIIPIMMLWKISLSLKNKIINTRIYSYEYSSLFRFYVFEEYDKNKNKKFNYNKNTDITTVHSKIYIIDDEVAYLGSLNFTTSGIYFNHEMIARTSNKISVCYIKDEIDKLISDNNYRQVSYEKFINRIYSEPIN